MVLTDLVEGFSDGGSGRRRLLPRLKRHNISRQRRGRSWIDEALGTDDPAYSTRNQEPLRDPLRPREHQPLHAGHCLNTGPVLDSNKLQLTKLLLR